MIPETWQLFSDRVSRSFAISAACQSTIRLILPVQPRFSVVAAGPRGTLTAAERIGAALMSLSSNLRSQQ
jgi:hypothetical protein